MPDNKVNERLCRIKVIDQLFSSNPGKTFSSEEIIKCVIEKNAEWKYDRHKLRRDLKFLEDEGCLRLKNVKCRPSSDRGRSFTKYGYQDLDASVFHDFVSDEDRLLIRDILDLLQLKGIESLKSFIRFDRKYGKDNSKNYSPIISFTKNPQEKKEVPKYLSSLLWNIRDRKCVKFKMKDRFVETKTTTHIVHPWYLREYNRRWYLFGLEGEDIEHYALDRMSKLTKCERLVYEAPKKSMEEILKHVIGVNYKKGDVPEYIIFWVSNLSSDFVLSKPMHRTMKPISIEEVRRTVPETFLESVSKKDGVFFKMNCIINYELRREMMSFGAELIVLWPNELRTRIKDILKRMCSNYD